jgi:hypothetical protein
MAWEILTEEKFKSALSEPERTALSTVALSPGQSDPLAEIISGVVAEIQQAIGNNPLNLIGEPGTLPAGAMYHALALVRYRYFTRLPGMSRLLDDRRVGEWTEANSWMKSKPRVEAPETASPEQIAGPGVQLVSSRDREFSRGKTSGL